MLASGATLTINSRGTPEAPPSTSLSNICRNFPLCDGNPREHLPSTSATSMTNK